MPQITLRETITKKIEIPMETLGNKGDATLI